jgi:peptidyl-prolyl cis-trans isomerase C
MVRPAAFAFVLMLASFFALGLSAPVAAQNVVPAPAGKAAAPADPVVGRINGQPVLRSEVLRESDGLPPQFRQVPIEALWPLLLDRVIDRKLIAAAAKSDGIAKDPDYQSRMKDIEERVLEQTFLEKRIDKQVTESAMQTRYAAMLKDMPAQTRIHARHIIVKTRDEAVNILRDLAKGGDFAAIAKSRSLDGSGQTGGDLGWITKDQVVEPFWSAAAAMKKGETSKAPVQTQFGWHVIRIDDVQADYKPSYDEERAQIQEAMSQEVETAERTRLRNAAKLERLTPDGSAPLPANPPAAPAR